MKKINDWVIKTFGLRGSWSWAKKQMLNGAIIKRKATTGTYKRPCKWVKDVHDEERDNYEFDECLEIYGFVRGCSSAVMILRPADDHGKDFNYVNSIYYQVFLTDSKEIIQHMIHGVIYGKWTFVKRGENFGIKLVKVLPGIHKCILRIAEKDIFGHESK